MTFRALLLRFPLVTLIFVLASCGPGITVRNKDEIAKFRVAPVGGNQIAYSVPSLKGQTVVMPGRDFPNNFGEGFAAGAISELTLGIDRANFEKTHGAGLKSIAANFPRDIAPKADRKLRTKLATTGRVTQSGGGLMRIEIEQVGVLSPPNPVGTIGGMLMNPFVVAKVSIQDAAGRTVVQDRILGLGETAGYKGVTFARQYLKDTKRKSLPFLHPKTGKSAATYGSNPALLRRDFDSAVYALGEDLDVFLKEVYGTP